MLDKLERSDFEGHVNQRFTIQFTPEHELVAVLIQVDEINSDSVLPRKPFSLLFETKQTDQYYTQGIYSVKHHELGMMEIFLVPMGFDVVSNCMRYEAVFS